MIDVFNEIYNALVGRLALYDDTITTSSVYENMPTDFPFVSLEEIDNVVYQNGMNDCEIENFSDIDYEVNIYTQNALRKTKANDILQVVDTFFKELGFIRMSKNNLQDNSGNVYRIVVRYSGVVSKDHIVYRR